jgi:hypothetical protein
VSDRDVHTEHCCIHHGCKYVAPQPPCTVISGEKKQSFPCEFCNEETKDESRIRQLEDKLDAIREAAETYEKDPINARDKPSSWAKLGALLKLAKADKNPGENN